MSNSPLVSYTKLSPNKTSPRNHKIDTVTIHCVVGQLSVESLGEVFATKKRKASSNYGVGFDGKIGLYVEESDASWCSSNSANDNRAITIEVASDLTEPYKITTAAYKSLVRLLVDICKRNGISELKWRGDKSLIGKIDKQNMTVHRWFANKSCPGDYLYDLHDQIAKEVNSQLLKTTYRVLIGDFSSLEDAEIAVRNAKAKGVLTHLIQSSDSVILEPVDEIAKEVIRGLWGNGTARKRRLTQAGYDYVVIQERVRELLD